MLCVVSSSTVTIPVDSSSGLDVTDILSLFQARCQVTLPLLCHWKQSF